MALKLCSVWSSCAPALLSQACRGLARLHVLTKAASCGQGREGLKSTKQRAPEGRWAVTHGVCQAGTARNEALRASPLSLRPSEWWKAQFGRLLSKKERSPGCCGSVDLSAGL